MHTGVPKDSSLYRALKGEDPFPANPVVDANKNVRTALGGGTASGRMSKYPYLRIKEIISSGAAVGQDEDALLTGLYAGLKTARGEKHVTPPIFEGIMLAALGKLEFTLVQLDTLVQW